jgi:hypothetical protein
MDELNALQRLLFLFMHADEIDDPEGIGSDAGLLTTKQAQD